MSLISKKRSTCTKKMEVIYLVKLLLFFIVFLFIVVADFIGYQLLPNKSNIKSSLAMTVI